jgi:inosine/xanthosine triphosphatase
VITVRRHKFAQVVIKSQWFDSIHSSGRFGTHTVKKVIVTSTNPVKLLSVRRGFEQMFPLERFEFLPISVPSGVPDQPRSESETRLGAANRIERARERVPDADYWVGIEGGVQTDGGDLLVFAWVEIRSLQITGRSRTGTFVLPPKVAELIISGLEMGPADDIVFGQSNSKQKNGAVGLLTHDVVDRTALYTQGVILALIPFANPALYSK